MPGDRWIPKSEDELREAVAGRVLVESRYLDFKAMVGAGDKANLGLAIDLASFATDSGTILVGVDESADPPTLSPVPLAGLKERVDQIGRSRVDPPLLVACSEIPAEGRPGDGYLVISVPASPTAPHMVDSIYRGRGDTTNIRLGDADVRRIRDQRRQGEFDIAAILRAEVERDPIEGEGRQNGHLFIVAEPVFAGAEMLVPVAGEKWNEWLYATFKNNAPRLTADWGPDIDSVARVTRGPRGWAMRSWAGERSSAVTSGEGYAIELEVLENGGLRLYAARGTDVMGAMPVLVDVLVFGFAWRVIDWARTVADQTGFVGNWRFGIALTRIGGARSITVAHRGFQSTARPFEGDGYEAWTEATFAEMTSDPGVVLERLVGRLNRALSDGTVPLPTRA